MSELHAFEGPGGPSAVALPFALDDLLADWRVMRRRMVRAMPSVFTRDEWAYVLSYVDPTHLESAFTQAFGLRGEGVAPPVRLFRPRGEVAIWLPNNVSLLGPLSLLLVSLTGSETTIKLGSRADDLVEPLLELLRAQADLTTLQRSLSGVRAARFDRTDPRNAAMAARARVRIAFGSDAAVQAILGQPGPQPRRDLGFGDRSSVAWVQAEALDDAALAQLIRVFALYGRHGCTSPRRVELVDATPEVLRDVVERLCTAWPQVVPADVPVHLASETRMSAQWGRALGLRVHPVDRQRALLVEGPAPEAFGGSRTLELRATPRDQLVSSLPANIQTLGHLLTEPDAPEWRQRVAASGAARFVPLRAMHHFGSVWDGQALFRELFDEVEFTCR